MIRQSDNLSINIATVNGSGSQTANQILLKSIFHMGIPVGTKNLFPSNISGMPTWLRIRANTQGFVGPQKKFDILINVNRKTYLQDLESLREGGLVLCEEESASLAPNFAGTLIAIPFKKLAEQVSPQIKFRKFLVNMIYVGVLAAILKIPQDLISEALANHFSDRQDLADLNRNAVEAGRLWALEKKWDESNFPALPAPSLKQGKILMDGNTASALGLLFGGCTVATWYPITPSTSVMENLIDFASEYRKDEKGTKFVALQVEDELAAIAGVLGAGWTGARALTATSGPGLSLMAEAAGFAYYAEIPAVIWNVQRAGPSTGLPTRTQQGDLIFARHLSHGDTLHPCLIPGNVKECFEYGQLCFDLAERLQQLVIVLSDLDLGMNLWMSDEPEYPTSPYDRGKIFNFDKLSEGQNFFRYQDTDQDGICYRTLPGTRHPQASYFTRGSGHNSKGQYTENPEEYQENIDRLKVKNEFAKTLIPKPLISGGGSSIGVISYGSTDEVLAEVDCLLRGRLELDFCRLRGLPFSSEVLQFISVHEKVLVLDQNAQGQMKMLLSTELPSVEGKLISLKYYNGEPLFAETLATDILNTISSLPGDHHEHCETKQPRPLQG